MPCSPASDRVGAALNVEPILRLALRTRRLPALARYAMTAALVLAALGARWWLLGPDPGWPFATFYPVVALAGIIFNGGTGLFATAFGAMLGVYFFIAPSTTWRSPPTETSLQC